MCQEYYSGKYENFRRVHYFFEMLGSLMNQNEVRKETFWRFFSFPIDYFIKTRNVRMIISDQKCLPSYAENFCWLFVYYNEYRKKYNKKWILNGEYKDVFNDYDASFLIFRNYKEYKEQCEKLFRKR